MYIQIYLASITFPEMLSFTCDGEHAFFFFPSLLLMYLIPHFYPETKKKKKYIHPVVSSLCSAVSKATGLRNSFSAVWTGGICPRASTMWLN